jgi:hypothetical protein
LLAAIPDAIRHKPVNHTSKMGISQQGNHVTSQVHVSLKFTMRRCQYPPGHIKGSQSA